MCLALGEAVVSKSSPQKHALPHAESTPLPPSKRGCREDWADAVDANGEESDSELLSEPAFPDNNPGALITQDRCFSIDQPTLENADKLAQFLAESFQHNLLNPADMLRQYADQYEQYEKDVCSFDDAVENGDDY